MRRFTLLLAWILCSDGISQAAAPTPGQSAVDRFTLHQKHMMGYQGWFACPGDGSAPNRWIHWFRRQSPAATNATFDFWPDMAELDADERFATSMSLPEGKPAQVFSSANAKTVDRHFRWMKEHNVDGVFLQRFASELSASDLFRWRNQVTTNVQAGAEKHGRVFAIMYDISGKGTNTLVSALTNDWQFLSKSLRVTESARYLQHQGKPVVAIWGFGFSGRQDTPAQARETIAFFKAQGVTVMGGLPTYWRTLRNDAQTNAEWAAVFRSFDVISPWAVGRYGDDAGADRFRANLIVPDLAEARKAGRDYMPVIFPGFSWHNLNSKFPLNQTPRRGGAFYWRQARNAVNSGCTMLYTAMFDEVDEGTAMFKLAPTRDELPVEGSFVPLDIDGQKLPSDWYLRVAGQATRMVRGEIPASEEIPIRPKGE